MDAAAKTSPGTKACCRGCPRHTGLCLALVFALLTGWSVLGTHMLNPMDTGWLKSDQAEIYLGWAFFRQDPQWHFPLTFTQRLSYPTGAPAAYAGSIPLVAIPLKAISSWLPANFQYLGLYSMLCFVLQAFFAYKLCRRFTGDDLLAGLGSLFFILAPPFIFRMVAHFDLIAHWIILAALWLYFAPERGARFYSRPLAYSLLLALSGGISPYISIMCLMVAAAAAARDTFFYRPMQWQRIVAWGIAPVVMAAAWIVFGFLEIGKKGDDYAAHGYRWFSMNILSPVDPNIEYTEVHSILFDGPTVRSGQYEGYNYLGAGVLLMILLVLVARRGLFKEITRPIYAPLWAVTLISFLLALSATVAFGPWIILKLPLPAPVEMLLKIFRSSGRLFWPGYYFILLFFIQFLANKFPRRIAVCGLSALLCLQIADTRSLHEHVLETHDLRDPGDSIFRNSFWNNLAPRFNKIVVLPAWQSRPDSDSLPGSARNWFDFGLLAASQGMTTNTCYLGRLRSVDLENQNSALPVAVRAGNLDADTVYILSPAYLAIFVEKQYTHIAGRVIDGMLVFWKDKADSPANLENLNTMLDTVLAGDLDLQQIASGFEIENFSIPYSPATGIELDEGQVLTPDGPVSEIPVFHPQKLAGGKIILDVSLDSPERVQNFSVALGSISLGEFSVKGSGRVSIDISQSLLQNPPASSRVTTLIFKWNPVSQRKADQDSETRHFRAVSIHAIRFQPGK